MVLPADSKQEYERALVAFGKRYDRDAYSSLIQGDHLLRRRAVRRTDYELDPAKEGRTVRTGERFTWTEDRVIRWGLSTDSERVRENSPEYLANMLCRTVDEVVSRIDTLLNTKSGIRGFEL